MLFRSALNSGFRNRLAVHLPRVLDVTFDLDDGVSPPSRWWQTGYALRHRVVHHAERPRMSEVLDGLRTAYELAAYVGRELERRPETAHLRGILPTQRIPAWRYASAVCDA